MTALRTYGSCTDGRGDVNIAVCNALRQVAANDEICQQAEAEGAVGLALSIAECAAVACDAIVLRSSLSLLRQLASSDAVKVIISESGGLHCIARALNLATEIGSTALSQQALGLLTNLTLRSPDTSVSAIEDGCVAAALSAMGSLLEQQNGGADQQAAALRQGCMALRNIASRCPEHREKMLKAGCEPILRQVKAKHFAACQDVASAALRDLGIDNYNS